MFDGSQTPRLFGLSPGVDFPDALVNGLRARLRGQSPEAMARVELIVNTTRMARRIREIFDAGPPVLLPRIRLVTDLCDPRDLVALPPAVSPLRRRLELIELVSRLLDSQPDLAPRTALFDLADSLVRLMDEMLDEGVPPAALAGLDVSDQSGHWRRALDVLGLVQRYFDADGDPPDQAGLQRLLLERLLRRWDQDPPDHPVIVAGSTGSRGLTHRLMRRVAGLPQGAVVLPGFDFEQPAAVWEQLADALTGEDHPQFRFARLTAELGVAPTRVRPWSDDPPPSAARNRLVSLALRPAPVTDQWFAEGPDLPPLPETLAGVTLVEAPQQRDEAMTIALRLRQAAEDGTSAVLITPDRMLTRQVSAALDRWDILPDDSAGTPAQLTPPGRFLLHVVGLFTRELTAEALLTLLKHPLCHSGGRRGPHLRNTRELELAIRRRSWPYPRAEQILEWGRKHDRDAWAEWVAARFCQPPPATDLPLADWLERLRQRADTLCAGADSDDSGALWAENAGREVRRIFDELVAAAPSASPVDARDFAVLFEAILSQGEVRDRDAAHPHILIRGTQEARVMGVDLLILGGLNEGSWPAHPGADPWLNRKMRHDAGLLLPERRIGLSAHDFQQAVAGREVWITRAVRSDDAETVPSRWLNRLTNLVAGLPERGGKTAFTQMRERGAHWLTLARRAEAPIAAPTVPRPSPAPPVAARPNALSVTEIKWLVRDPFAIYARHVLRLRPLDPLQKAPDALMRGILIHRVLDNFVRRTRDDPAALDPGRLLEEARAVLADPETVPFPAMRHLWTARMARVAEWFVASERERQGRAVPGLFETKGRLGVPEFGFSLTARADRIDIDDAGRAYLYDYKTGDAPSPAQQAHFDKQLLLEAAMAEAGGFADLGPRRVAHAVFVALGSTPREVPAPLDDMPPEQIWQEFTRLVAAYADVSRGYTARRAHMKENDRSDYDHLARHGEWDAADPPAREILA